ncbi:rod shape-determining protein RodA [Phaeocystidibacter marisrubri]|uniref:Cell wall polymerase n=1 Tax=Phaeocystidibacter marisrubri TaxID=1577780 RepID=A0A6L3ZEC4_9FLAO|nr:rod shape-determining protein RodA [Phaeocystidibacter marisrubri]KAB2815807.1 rod shape-determining protein RodA [Phaeocystidibacter marisrubri]GGH65807.1 rod shape-determining protein RodA [Phaeocystidibacter marisrubri]
MSARARSGSVFTRIDKWTVFLYAALVFLGWINIYAAVYSEEHKSIMDTSQQYGKQMIWIFTSGVLILAILLSDVRLYHNISYPVYGATLLLLVLVLIIGKEIGGNKSWIQLGSFSLQPSEFAKFGTALAMSKYLSTLQVDVREWRYRWWPIVIMGLPMLLILAQPDTGSALVFVSFMLVLYREGLPGMYLFLAFLSALVAILSLVFPPIYVIGAIIVTGGLAYWTLRNQKRITLTLIGLVFYSSVVAYGTSFMFNNVLQTHQRDRISVLLGLKDDPMGVGYHTQQSLIAIGSGGLSGKGFLEGTQTKLNYVPEQSTDYIFCTVGEEWGFVGSSITVLLFLGLLGRLTFLAERQKSNFARIYGYSVVGILFIHFAVNIAMTLGLAPVIGIPLPFFSYGGSSLWGFTTLLFIFIRLDANRWDEL